MFSAASVAAAARMCMASICCSTASSRLVKEVESFKSVLIELEPTLDALLSRSAEPLTSTVRGAGLGEDNPAEGVFTDSHDPPSVSKLLSPTLILSARSPTLSSGNRNYGQVGEESWT
mmetsp:Transcript_64931/g.118480  ORF Transcript_64931/g.118480 Transcript_64931/m.118480 type:complete len:118 (+) Transcript_64931:15-368(+)